MGTLVMFELKKILGNKAGIVACVLALAILLALAVLNYTSSVTRDRSTGEVVFGAEAQQSLRTLQESHAGLLTDERVAADAATLDRANQLGSQKPDFFELDNPQIIDAYGLEFWQETRAVAEDGYYLEVVGTLDAASPRATSLQEGAEARIESALNSGFADYFPYSEAERAYWTNKFERISWPLTYGYAEGWSFALRCLNLSGLLIIAACIALAGSFAGEYQTRAVAVALPTKRGKRTLPLAKAVASFLFVTAYWWICVLAISVVNIVGCGADGWGLPLQAIRGFGNPYPLTVGQTMMAVCGLGYLIALGMAALTLLLSAKLRSTMPVAVAPMAIAFLGLLGVYVTQFTKIVAVTPLVGLNYAFGRMLSYSASSIAVDLPTMLVILYAVMLVVLTPLAMRAFLKHQVV